MRTRRAGLVVASVVASMTWLAACGDDDAPATDAGPRDDARGEDDAAATDGGADRDTSPMRDAAPPPPGGPIVRPVLGRRLFADRTLSAACAGTYAIGARACTGTDGDAFATIAEAEAAAIAGDVVYVREGTYEETITMRRGGDADAWITFARWPADERPVVRGIVAADHDYLRFVGFEITHTAEQAGRHGVDATGSESIEVHDCFVHSTGGGGVRVAGFGGDLHTSSIVVRGNRFDHLACIEGAAGLCAGNGSALGGFDIDHVLFEYNDVSRAGDFANVHGTHAILRNNVFRDFRDAYWPEIEPGALHADIFQPCGGMVPTQHHVYEANVAYENAELNSHFLQMRNTSGGDDDLDILFRMNVGHDFGSYGMQSQAIDAVTLLHNTFVRFNEAGGAGNPVLGFDDFETNGSNGYVRNCLFAETPGRTPIAIDVGSRVVTDGNLCFASGAHESCASTDDPRFASSADGDLHIGETSAARGLGVATAHAVAPGVDSTTLAVDDGAFFFDGFGMVAGDRIVIGSSAPVRVRARAENVLELAAPRTWAEGDPVGLAHAGDVAHPDVGALPYRASG